MSEADKTYTVTWAPGVPGYEGPLPRVGEHPEEGTILWPDGSTSSGTWEEWLDAVKMLAPEALTVTSGETSAPATSRMDDLAEAVLTLLPACSVLRSVEPALTCLDLVGATFGNGGVWTEEMCCLPCRIRAMLAEFRTET